jgi:hypothetical protein
MIARGGCYCREGCPRQHFLKNARNAKYLQGGVGMSARYKVVDYPGIYPRIQAQLWCYSWIDDWLDAKDVLLVCEWWVGERALRHRPSFWRSRRDTHRECLRWFIQYGGNPINLPEPSGRDLSPDKFDRVKRFYSYSFTSQTQARSQYL